MSVLETAKRVAAESRHVRINARALEQVADLLAGEQMEVPAWDYTYHFFDGSKRSIAYLLVLDSLNFCFWPPEGQKRWEISYGPERLSGYYALAASLKKTVEAGIPITEASFLATLSLDDLKGILAGEGVLQLLEERHAILRDLGHFLLRDFGGEPSGLLDEAGGSALLLVRLLADRLASFRDTAFYNGYRVYFHKRAQILAADIFAAFQGKGWGHFHDIEALTTFADYKVPQVLRGLGVLHYATELGQKVDGHIPIPAGSAEEVEIRANTVWAVEKIREESARRGRGLKAIEIDWILWNMGQDPAFKARPYHRTVTIFY